MVIYNDSLFFSSLISALRSVGCCVLRGDARDENFCPSDDSPDVEAIIIDISSIPSDTTTGSFVFKLQRGYGPVRLILIGNNEKSMKAFPAFDGNVILFRPPIDLKNLFETLEINDEPGRETERQQNIIRDAVDSSLISAGFSRQMTGFEPIKAAVSYIVSNNCRRMRLSGEVYDHTGLVLNIRPSAVERSIRVSIAEVWNELPERMRKNVFGSDHSDHPPSNRDFLYTFARRVSDEIAPKLNMFSKIML